MVKRVWTACGLLGGFLFLSLVLVSLIPQTGSDTLTIPNTFSIGQVADPNTVNANFTAIANIVNGKIDNGNWDTSGPRLSYDHVDLTSKIVSADIVDGTVVNIDLAADSIHNANVIDGTLISEDLGLDTISSLIEPPTCNTSDHVFVDTVWFTIYTHAAYQPLSTGSDLFINWQGSFVSAWSAGGQGQGTIEIQIDGVTKCTAVYATANIASANWVTTQCILSAPAGFPYDIVVRGKKENLGGTSSWVYQGSTRTDCIFNIIELKR